MMTCFPVATRTYLYVDATLPAKVAGTQIFLSNRVAEIGIVSRIQESIGTGVVYEKSLDRVQMPLELIIRTMEMVAASRKWKQTVLVWHWWRNPGGNEYFRWHVERIYLL